MKYTQKILKSPWAYFLIILILIISFYSYKEFKNSVQEKNDFAKYLTEQGAVMYGTEWCSHCKTQKKLFGTSFKYINYVDCDKDQEQCKNAGVSGYPTWKINNQNYPGVQTLEKLAQLTKYEGRL